MEMAELTTLLHIPKLPLYLSQVEQQLKDRFLTANPAIRVPALRLINSGGKRLRPALVIAASARQGARIDSSVISAATAIELVHLGSIVHDDIIDHADRRGNQPTVYAKEGIDSAVLVGDYMLAAAANEATSVSGKVGVVVSSAIMEMCEGQMQETVDAYNINRSIKNYLESIHKKTAVLIGAACNVGGLLAKAPVASLSALRDYGEAFGVAFQLMDDLLDFLADSKTMGKPVHNDLKEGVYTMPLLLTLHGPSGALVRPWIGKEPKHPVSYSEIVDRLLRDGSFDSTVIEIKLQNARAVSAINGLGSSEVIHGLRQLPELYMLSALNKQKVLP